jgi:hypothetical protein
MSPPPMTEKKTEVPFRTRHLTSGEIAMARTVFGDKINYNAVVIRHLPDFIKAKGIAPFGDIYVQQNDQVDLYSADYSKDTKEKKKFFIHEMTHVWQHQSGRSVVAEALMQYVVQGGNYQRAYTFPRETADESKLNIDFNKLNLEQQAVLLANYYEYRNDQRTRTLADPVLRAAGFTPPPLEIAAPILPPTPPVKSTSRGPKS